MNGLQTLQKINDATIAFRNAKRGTKPCAIVNNFRVFEPNGYEVIYHPEDILPEYPELPVIAVEFTGEDAQGPRFTLRTGAGDVVRSARLEELFNCVTHVDAEVAADLRDRLTRLFVSGVNA